MSNYQGDYSADATVYVMFDSVDGLGASVTITGLAVTDIEVYKDGSVTQRSSDSGYTLLDTDGIDFDGTTGVHGFSIDTSDNTDAGFYAAGSDYHVVVNSITLEGQTVSFVAAHFSIENRNSGGSTPPTAAAIADAVWDELISGHQTAGTFGRYGTMAGPILVDTTIAAGTPTTTTFELTAGSTLDDFYNDMLIYIVSGTGTGQARPVEDYIGSTKQIIVDEPWITTPAVGDQVIVLAAHAHPLSQISGAILGVAGAAMSNLEFLMVDSTTKDPSTGLTVTGEKSIDGGAFAAVTGTIAEVGNGIYQFDASAADMNGEIITFRFSSAGADDTFITYKTAG
jgi:hypothetical protein